MTNNGAAGEDCPARDVFSRLGGKWSMRVVGLLRARPLRFNELRRSAGGISQRMLTRTLRGLERDGLVTRTVTPTTPPSVTYALTDVGRTLLKPAHELASWARKNRSAIDVARSRFDARHDPALPSLLRLKRPWL